VAIEVFLRSPVLVEHEAAGIARVHVQVILHAAVFPTCGFDQRQNGTAERILFTGFRLHFGDYSQELGHIDDDGTSTGDFVLLQLAVERGASDA
jgi:hypothetical protein